VVVFEGETREFALRGTESCGPTTPADWDGSRMGSGTDRDGRAVGGPHDRRNSNRELRPAPDLLIVCSRPSQMVGAQVRRREVISLVGGAVLVGPGRVSAQPTGRSYRVARISVNDSFTSPEPYQVAFVERLRVLGFVEGRNLTIESLHADGKLERLPALT